MNRLLLKTGHEMPGLAQIRKVLEPDGTLRITLAGRLEADTLSRIWPETALAIRRHGPRRVLVEAGGVEYCDGSGLAMLVDFRRQEGMGGGPVEILGLKDEFTELLDGFDPADFRELDPRHVVSCSVPVQVGQAAVRLWHDLAFQVAFVGELTAALGGALVRPGKVRWRDVILTAERAGADAFPIVALISFLIGLIIAFQSAIPLKQFGGEVFVADLVALSMLRELGPLMTAIMLAGRSGSAFAAEIGTMKVNEEINALTTLGLDPVRFLVVPRLIAAVIMTPMLALFSNLMGLIGGSLVFLSLGFSLRSYQQQVQEAIDPGDLWGGLFKAFVFGILVAGIGCLRGLQTQSGASAVGVSATRAVVSGILLIIIADGIFSVVFYYLGI